MFLKIDGAYFREAVRYIESQLSAVGREFESALPFNPPVKIESVLARVLPPDDSALQFSPAGVGVSDNLDNTLQQLFQRHVERYTHSAVMLLVEPMMMSGASSRRRLTGLVSLPG